MIPNGFLEDPYVYPAMSCPTCGYRFVFKEPFQEFSIIECPECQKEAVVPDNIIDQFCDNIFFADYLKRRRQPPAAAGDGPRPASSQTPPPIY